MKLHFKAGDIWLWWKGGWCCK